MDEEGWSGHLRARARELALSDAEVARRVGLSQARYENYVAGRREPDLATLVRICRVLRTTPDAVLGFRDGPGEDERTMLSAMASLVAMDPAQLDLAASVLAVMVAHSGGTEGRSVRRTASKRALPVAGRRRPPTGT